MVEAHTGRALWHRPKTCHDDTQLWVSDNGMVICFERLDEALTTRSYESACVGVPRTTLTPLTGRKLLNQFTQN